MTNATKKLLITLAVALAVLILPAATTCNEDDHTGIAFDTGIGTVQIGDAMDLSCAANPNDVNCDAFK